MNFIITWLMKSKMIANWIYTVDYFCYTLWWNSSSIKKNWRQFAFFFYKLSVLGVSVHLMTILANGHSRISAVIIKSGWLSVYNLVSDQNILLFVYWYYFNLKYYNCIFIRFAKVWRHTPTGRHIHKFMWRESSLVVWI